MTDKTCVVTGASSGIGFAIAEAFANANYQVIGLGQNVAELDRLARSHFEPYSVDLTDDQALARCTEHIIENNPKLSVLIHCAGIHHLGAIATASVDQMDAMYRLNIRVPVLLTQALLPGLKTSAGDVVFLNSSITQQVRENAGGFSMSQNGLKAIADTLRLEVNQFSVRVLSVFPGRTATPRTQKLFSNEQKPYHPSKLLQPEDIADLVLHSVSLPKTAELTDLFIRPAIKTY